MTDNKRTHTHRPSGAGGGSPYKGERAAITVRIPLDTLKDIQNIAYDYVANVNDVVNLALQVYISKFKD